jgi:hypothetical protein
VRRIESKKRFGSRLSWKEDWQAVDRANHFNVTGHTLTFDPAVLSLTRITHRL